ncbi:class I SAM-dependent methyltransferase [Haliangium sp. UPWRP_2]|uniref:class I SAM-dependent methyltransferase n=1 Tax=Haliangium sp. UPWRP_2 TaxID=1931276 RepID=UPI000D0DAFFF|nr:class I SAM-dependent methyltransferase [Haliangium sp. UPWRP_2]PSM31917.1 SAM-dependent methyltransferase [Haliangium sp. UPWRP_2]
MLAPPPSPHLSVEPEPREAAAQPRVSAHTGPDRAQLFRNRLRKNLRRLQPWIKQQGIEAYRLYNSDIPEVRLIVERYGDYLALWEYSRAADRDLRRDTSERSAEHEAFLHDVVQALAQECRVPPERIVVKRRERQRGRAQYQKLAETQREIIVHEGGHRFRVNLQDYLDTGLFLDHRGTRALVGSLSAGRRVLNLFGYTGSFTVYAAAGGARQTLTIDLSNTYLDWTERNLRENGLDLSRHRLLRADVLAWLREPPSTTTDVERDGFDLIVLDPPTFSNSKRMRDTLDIVRDHPWLLSQVLQRLRAGGQLLFSCNHRRFALRQDELPEADSLHIRDLSAETLPPDFHDPRTRCCYLISRR